MRDLLLAASRVQDLVELELLDHGYYARRRNCPRCSAGTGIVLPDDNELCSCVHVPDSLVDIMAEADKSETAAERARARAAQQQVALVAPRGDPICSSQIDSSNCCTCTTH